MISDVEKESVTSGRRVSSGFVHGAGVLDREVRLRLRLCVTGKRKLPHDSFILGLVRKLCGIDFSVGQNGICSSFSAVRNARVPLAGGRVPPGSLTEQAFTTEGLPSVSPARFWQQNLLHKKFVLVTVKHVCSDFVGHFFPRR